MFSLIQGVFREQANVRPTLGQQVKSVVKETAVGNIKRAEGARGPRVPLDSLLVEDIVGVDAEQDVVLGLGGRVPSRGTEGTLKNTPEGGSTTKGALVTNGNSGGVSTQIQGVGERRGPIDITYSPTTDTSTLRAE